MSYRALQVFALENQNGTNNPRDLNSKSGTLMKESFKLVGSVRKLSKNEKFPILNIILLRMEHFQLRQFILSS